MQFSNLLSQTTIYLTDVQQDGVVASIVWAHFRYLFLCEGSPEPYSIGVCRRLLQSVFKVEWGIFSVKLQVFIKIQARDRKISKGFLRISG